MPEWKNEFPHERIRAFAILFECLGIRVFKFVHFRRTKDDIFRYNSIMMKIRLQKYCSQKGIASRRKAEEYIENGWIKVNGRVVTELGIKVDPEKDDVELCEKAKQAQKEYEYVLLNKPVGYVTNLPQKGEKEAAELLPAALKRLKPVGRLDKDSQGLLLFTNDGVVAHRLTSPKFEHEKEYEVKVDKLIAGEVLDKYRRGIVILRKKIKPVKVTRLKGKTYSFVLCEGKNRQIRRMLNKFGYKVINLKRIRIMNLYLGKLKPGKYRALSEKEKQELNARILGDKKADS
jgi:23S rRNA pseudouridine2605 synthase